jgi:methylated-DNA-[protein]-cysteine S-methyltransferase
MMEQTLQTTFRTPSAPGPFAKALWRAEFSARGLRCLSVTPNPSYKGNGAGREMPASDPRLRRLKKLVERRMSGKRVDIDFAEFDLEGAPDFHLRIWRAMHAIPFGEVLSYAELAGDAGSPLAFRACGQACRMNRIILFIPCHRVVSSSGIGGFACGLHWKRALLELEGTNLFTAKAQRR